MGDATNEPLFRPYGYHQVPGRGILQTRIALLGKDNQIAVGDFGRDMQFQFSF